MREILFRGKSIESLTKNKWIIGWYCPSVFGSFPAIPAIIDKQDQDNGKSAATRIDITTLGQFTGLYDKNGKKIFEGDIVVTRYESGEICSIGDIQFDCGVFGAEWKCHKQNKTMIGSWGQRHNLRKLDDDIIDKIEVIGDIYDNPELLGD